MHKYDPEKCPFPCGILAPTNYTVLGPPRVHTPNSISIDTAIFAGYTIVTNRHTYTDHATSYATHSDAAKK